MSSKSSKTSKKSSKKKKKKPQSPNAHLKGTTGSGIPRSQIVLSREEDPDYEVGVPAALNPWGFAKLMQPQPFASAAVLFQAIREQDDDEIDRCLALCYCSPTKRSTCAALVELSLIHI